MELTDIPKKIMDLVEAGHYQSRVLGDKNVHPTGMLIVLLESKIFYFYPLNDRSCVRDTIKKLCMFRDDCIKGILFRYEPDTDNWEVSMNDYLRKKLPPIDERDFIENDWLKRKRIYKASTGVTITSYN